ncbi:Variant surface glycoprotein [Trypanosoma congolense IL3000]|uniref:Variant surface glycoprotein n=1 Tax=Trypanosoma congolense (strain IL3000) TaxID=1068625 RepID=F9WG91_TRYCI|nr:Variant surface glycoprotein [Trypanosoma congolense IL3000]
MAFSMIAISIITFNLLGVASGQVEVARDDNIEPFSLLCRIYNVAKNPPINYVDMEEGYNIVEEINALNRSLLEEERLHEKDDAGNSSEAQVKPTVTRDAAVAQLGLNQISQRAHTIWEKIKRMNVTKEIGNAKAEFAQVIFGENGNERNLDHTALSGVNGREDACGKPGGGTKGINAGKSLVVDFFCLCAQRPDGAGINQVCGFYVGSNRENGLLGWNDTHGPEGSLTMWSSIKGGCGKHMRQHPKSSAEAHHILDQFLKHLRTGGVYRWGQNNDKSKAVKEKEGMLGTGVGKEKGDIGNGPVCDGKKGNKGGQSPSGICVYYGAESNSWEGKIPWLKTFETALATVEEINNQTATIQRSLEKLQMLLHRAEEIYETTKVMLEIQNPEKLATLPNARGNLTAYNATRTRSYSPNSYLFPALVLLLL